MNRLVINFSKGLAGMYLLVFMGIHIGYGQTDSTKTAETDFSLKLQAENRYFVNEGIYDRQKRSFFSLSAQPEFSIESANGKHNAKVSLFGRWDQFDDNRTHADIRELYYQHVAGNLEVSLGLKKVYWGVTESLHLVDVINQTDQVESFDGEQKLGQPMLHLSYLSKVGNLDFFYLPYARKRVFPAQKGRLRFPSVIEQDDIRIDSKSDHWRPSLAARWSHYIGSADVSVSHFYGVGREPLFLNLETSPDFIYPIMNQTGVTVQLTTGSALWKFEGIYRTTKAQDVIAFVSGLEFTFGNIGGSGLDIGLLGEYLYDDRGDFAISNMDNDVFLGTRWAFNDVQSTAILAGYIFDLDKNTQFISMEAERRFGNSWKASLEARFFEKVDAREFAYFFRNDSFLSLNLSRFF